MPNRCEELFKRMTAASIPAAWIASPENIRYLTGYTGEGALFIADGLGTILTDFRYVEQAGREAPECALERTSAQDRLPLVLSRLMRALGLSSLAFEPQVVTVSEYDDARAALEGVELMPLGGLPEQMRAIKDAYEIECLVKASDIACAAFEQLLPFIKPGMTERQIQQELDYTMLRLGSEQVAFQTIACAGPNGSLPHATPSDRPIQRGELLTLDFGAQVNGYKCDMTRTIAIGDITDELRAIYDAVLKAQTAAFAAIKPGAICSSIDKIARDILDASYPGAFGHSLGHGVGLFIHENPNFNSRCEEPLMPGHVLTVEPGVYIPGLGGCRIEDMAIITEDGYLDPITASKDLITV